MPYCPVCDRDFPAANLCPQCGNQMLPRASAGFAVSLIGGAIITITALILLMFWSSLSPLLFLILPWLAPLGYYVWVLGLIAGLVMMVGSAVIYLPGKEHVGAAIVLIFSIISLVVLGGLIVGFTMGIVGAALGFAKK
jgi:hypothetical protein